MVVALAEVPAECCSSTSSLEEPQQTCSIPPELPKNSLSMCTHDRDSSPPPVQGGIHTQLVAIPSSSISQPPPPVPHLPSNGSSPTEPLLTSTAPPPAATAITASNTTRKVYFGLQHNQIIPPSGVASTSSSLLDKQQRWYSKFEYQAWEAILAKQAKHLRQEPPRPFSYAHTWEHLDHVCHHIPTGDEGVGWQLPLTERQALERLVAKGAPIGLERWAVPRLEKHGEARKQQLYKLLATRRPQHTRKQDLTQHSDDPPDGRHSDSSDHAAEEDDHDESLAHKCQRISRPSRFLATATGQALAAVLRRDQESQSR